MKKVLRIALYIYLVILLVLALLPLTGYYAAFAALPVVGYVLYRVFILEDKTPHEIVTRSAFLLATLVFLLGFALNMFCTLYTAYRTKQFRDGIEADRKAIYQELK